MIPSIRSPETSSTCNDQGSYPPSSLGLYLANAGDPLASIAMSRDPRQPMPGPRHQPRGSAPSRKTATTVYRMWARGGRSPLLDTLDCPDPSTTTPRRARTTTPLQALALFNNAFVLHQADRFADRVRREAGGDTHRQVTRAYALAYGRPPSAKERGLLVPFIERHGLEALARVIFNTSEFVQAE